MNPQNHKLSQNALENYISKCGALPPEGYDHEERMEFSRFGFLGNDDPIQFKSQCGQRMRFCEWP
jgi:hypothetical protein